MSRLRKVELGEPVVEPKQVERGSEVMVCDLCCCELKRGDKGVLFGAVGDMPAEVGILACRWCIAKVNRVAQRTTL